MRKRPVYQARPSEITRKAWERGYIEAFELTRIAAWKNARSVATITLNEPEHIEACTRAAIAVVRPWRGRAASQSCADSYWTKWQKTANSAIGWVKTSQAPASGLLSLQGVGYPMASAILDILDPDVWPIIGKWAVKTVFGAFPPPRYTAARYAAYAKHLVTEGAQHWGADLSIHKLDERAQQASMQDGHLPPGWQTAPLPPL